MTLGKIEHYSCSMKNAITLQRYEYLWDLGQTIGDFVENCHKPRVHKSPTNLMPQGIYLGI